MRMLTLRICLLAAPAFWAAADGSAPPELPFQAVDQAGQAQTAPPQKLQPLPPAKDIQRQVEAAAKPQPGSPAAPKPASQQDAAAPQPAEPTVAIAPAPAQPPVGKRSAPPAKRTPAEAGSVKAMSDWMSSRRGKPPAASDPPTPTGGVIRARQGQSCTLAIARGQLNRIVTPFADPKVLTVSAIEAKVEGSSVYVATDSATPANLFISDADGTDAISLELAPADGIRPAEVRIELEKAPAQGVAQPGEGREGRGDHPYVADLKRWLRTLALGGVPQGFTLGELPPGQAAVCAMPGLAFRPGQWLAGVHANLLVFVAANTADGPVDFNESACAARGVMAVAAWPRFRVHPGEKTEVYVAVRVPPPAEAVQARPSLLGQ
jgi:conjugal transfer pilus assembly protein TraK